MFDRSRHNVGAAHPQPVGRDQVQYDQNGRPFVLDNFNRPIMVDPNQVIQQLPQQQQHPQVFYNQHGQPVDRYGNLLQPQWPNQPQQPTQWPNQPQQPTQWPNQPQQPSQWPNQQRQQQQWPNQQRQQQQWPNQPATNRYENSAVVTAHRFGQPQQQNVEQGMGFRGGDFKEKAQPTQNQNFALAVEVAKPAIFKENLTMTLSITSSTRLDKSRVISPDNLKTATVIVGDTVNGSLNMESALLDARVHKVEKEKLGNECVFYTEMSFVPSIYFGKRSYQDRVHAILTAENVGVMALELRKLANEASSTENPDRALVLLVNELDELLTSLVNDFLVNELKLTPLEGYKIDSFASDIEGLVVAIKANNEDLYVSLFLSGLSDLKNKFQNSQESYDGVKELLSETDLGSTVLNQKYLISVVDILASEIIDAESMQEPIVIDNSDTGIKLKELIKYCDNHATIKTFNYQQHYLVTLDGVMFKLRRNVIDRSMFLLS